MPAVLWGQQQAVYPLSEFSEQSMDVLVSHCNHAQQQCAVVPKRVAVRTACEL